MVAITAAGAYIYLDDLHGETTDVYAALVALGEEQRQLDQAWLASDEDKHGAILVEVEGVRSYLEGRLGGDASALMYQLGLRDGARACE